ncbi:hypothetical protein KAI52_01775 [Candidatus Parcubacteria bacterium]|nr:hypothetical protein [Candidatus Parcubacteria bacterium]
MINRILEKISGKWIFLIIVAIIYLIALAADFALARRALLESVFIFKNIIPVFLLVIAFMFLSNFFLDSKKISRFVGESAGIKGWLIAVVGGILSSGPIYMWYPLLADLKEKGMKDSFIAVFLYNRAVKIPMLPMMIYYFGLPFTVMLTFYMILFSIINGVFVEKLLKLK